jgi:hypothetical protein
MMGSLLPLTPVASTPDGEPSFPKLRNALVIHSEPHRANASHPAGLGRYATGRNLRQ